MTTYRMLCIIPTYSQMPGQDPDTISDEHLNMALSAATRISPDMATYSDGALDLDVSIRVMTDLLPSSRYSEPVNPGEYVVTPGQMAAWSGDRLDYDIHFAMQGGEGTTASTFRGFTTTDGIWMKVGDKDEFTIGPHELMHWFTVYLGGEGYDNFPSCGDGIPAAHCAVEYGFKNDLDPEWLTAFFTAGLDDNTGINDTGWAVATPTEQADRVVPSRYTPKPTPWGMLGVLRP